MLGLIVTALLVAGASLALGSGILVACGQKRPTWLAGGVGYAALLAMATLAIRLPGAVPSTLVVLGVAVATSAVCARGTAPGATPALEAGVVVAAVLLMLCLPFIAAGHFGPLGVSLDNDLGFHVGWVESLRGGHPPVSLPPFGYPTGGEALAASLVWLAGSGEQALLGVTAAAPILTALAAMGLLERAPRALRLAGACAVGVPYLVAAYFGEGSLKEVQMAVLVLTFGALSQRRLSRRDAAPLGVLGLGMFASFGTAGLLWPAAILTARALWTSGWGRRRALVRRFAGAGIGVALGVVVAALVYAGRSRFGTGAFGGAPVGGNLARELPITEGLGVWPGADFRLPAHPEWAAVLLSGGALVALVVALALSVRQRVWQVCVPAGACVGVYLVSRAVVTPYESAKALVIAGPLIVLTILLPLGRAASGPGTRARPLGAALAGVIVAGAVVATSAEALRNSPVDSPSLGRQLQALRPLLIGRRVLFLGNDDWVRAELYGTDLFVPRPYGGSQQEFTPVRTWKGPKPPNDFDTVPTALLARVDYVITTRTTDASAPPASFSVSRSTAGYLLWARRGPTADRYILPEGPEPGAVLDCATPVGRRVVAQIGVAAVRTAPIVGSPWQVGPTVRAPVDSTGLAFLAPGSRATSTIALPVGRWALDLDYQSPGAVTVEAGGARGVLPGRLEPVGARWDVATVTSNGAPLPVQVSVAARPAPAIHPGALIGRVEAVPEGWSDVRSVPLRQACGRYVDWFRLGA